MTPLDIAACAWAGTATVIGIGACMLAEYQRRWKVYWANEAEELVALINDALDQRDDARSERDNALFDLSNYQEHTARAVLAANKRWSRAMHLLRTAEKQNRALVDAQLAGELERLVA